MTSAGPARDRLLQAVVEQLAGHGIADRSLRALAAATGTSHRMLIYHFGSREGLLAEVVGVVEAGQRETLAALTAEPGTGPREIVDRFWTTVSAGARRYGPLFYELSAHAMQGQEHARSLHETLVAPWIEPLGSVLERAGLPPAAARTRARLIVGAARGLLHDALVTGEFTEADAAMSDFTAIALPT
ncbi:MULTISPECIES: TetR/AcrR family transcriptional regulator [Pseudonocardia]|uniref:Bacterial regulatory protein n=2 Tax=Pseudonocardia TaxID=1847 RepID=A0A1Y2MNW6_PSEAH|nr:MULTISPECIES: TetR family transcriptional regulator [Pseudonocardia]OSY36933.1 Bacterial regulatory protein [Pseudonocardia autotrophica]TDN75616.1 TetR family transcriptional regulator [Pseudonocardia autotrophica]BBF99587.1 TetR family transcriptional regulator [Pseudonocardia autotrophica]GEC28606.1 TetR family transcriptional regulator [Pseudonocardia saturnea]